MALNQSIAANCAVRETQVSTESCKLRDTLNLLNDCLVELGNRIEAVLRSESECSTKDPSVPKEYLVPLAEDYRNNREHVEAMITRVGSYLNRLEL